MGSLTLFGSSKQKSVQLLEKKIWRNQIMRVGKQHYVILYPRFYSFYNLYYNRTLISLTVFLADLQVMKGEKKWWKDDFGYSLT
jgi:hypothetical protein